MEAYESTCEPVLLVEVSCDGKLTMHKRNLANFLKPIENMPVSVVSIAGPQCSGKSLLFGYLARYLIATELDEFIWIDSDNPEKPLTEFQWPNDGKSPKSAGIWAFPRAFILEVDRSSKQKVAVILLFVQLSHRQYWGETESEVTALLGLSLAISSTNVFNFYKHIDENCLSYIASAIKCALTGGGVMKGSSQRARISQRPFQNSSFVVRDWNFPSEFPYGTTGGSNFIKTERLKIIPGHSKQSRESRQLINGLFENISGCLFPFPGNKVISPDDFHGSIDEMDPQFSKHLTDFVGNLISIDESLIIRNSQGNSITGKVLKEIMEKYVSNLGEIDISSLQASRVLKEFRIIRNIDRIEPKEYLNPSLKRYAEIWQKHERSRKFFDEKTLITVQGLAKKEAMQTFENEFANGGDDDNDDENNEKNIKEQMKRRLNIRIAKKFQAISKENEKKKIYLVEEWKDDLIQQYRDSMERPIGVRKSTEVAFRRESKNVTASLKAEFSKRLEEIKIKEGMNHEKANFDKRLTDEEKKFSETLFMASRNYVGDDEIGNPRKFESISHFAGRQPSNDINGKQRNSTSNFSRSSGFSDVSTSDLGSIRDLEDDSNDENEKLKLRGSQKIKKNKDQQKKDNEASKEKAKKLIECLKICHETELEGNIEMGADELLLHHDNRVKDLLERYDNEAPYSTDSQEFGTYQEILKDELKMVLKAAQTKQRKSKQRKCANVISSIKLALSNYESQLQELRENNELSETQVIKKDREIREQILEEIRCKVGNMFFGEDAEQTERDMEDIFEKLQIKVTRSMRFPEDKSATLINKVKKEYTSTMKNVAKLAEDEKTFEAEHEKVVQELISKFEVTGSAQAKPSIISEIKRTLGGAYLEAQKIFGLSQQNQQTSFKLAIREARQLYRLEMDKQKTNNEHTFNANLETFHSKTCDAARKKFPGLKWDELKQSLNLELQKYQDEVEMNKDKEPAIGIDLGTTYSCVSVYRNGKVEIIPNSVGKLTTPSYVLIQGKGMKDIVGEEAKSRAYENPEGTIFDAKRILGRRFDDKKLQEDMRLWPFSVVDGGRGIPMIEISGRKLHPEIISSKLLKQLKKDAENHLRRTVRKAVITVPAYFTDGQKQATMDAGEMAGLEVISILTEPVAAAMAYQLQYSFDEDDENNGRHILIFDLGGGTFDVAILKTSQGKIEVLTVDGDTHLGGEDFDKNVMNYCAEEFRRVHKVDLFDGKDSPLKKTRDDVRRRLKRVQAECERQKIALATARSATVNLDNIFDDLDLNVTVTKATFERINQKLFDATIKVVESALKAARLDKSKINDIVLVGGSTRIPKVQDMLKRFFGGKELDKKINPDEAVAHGAGLMAAIRRGNIEKTSKNFTKIQDVTPMSIGVELKGGGFSVIIPKSTKVPMTLGKTYETSEKNQTRIKVSIYEGENEIAKQNKHLGDFILGGIPPKKAGEETIDVEMEISEQGILHVSAKCNSTGERNAVTVTENKMRMGRDDIQRYLSESN